MPVDDTIAQSAANQFFLIVFVLPPWPFFLQNRKKQIWDACDSMKRGVLSQDELFRALAFIGLAQAGEEPKDTVLNMRTEPPPIKVVEAKHMICLPKLIFLPAGHCS